MKNYYSFSRTFKLCALILLTFTGVQSLSALSCFGGKQVSISGSQYVVTGEEIIQSTDVTVVSFTVRLDGMNGQPVPSGILTCDMLLGEPRTIWMMVNVLEADGSSNSCMNTFTITDKLAPTISCETAVVECDEPFSNGYIDITDVSDACTGVASLTGNPSAVTMLSNFLGAFDPLSADVSLGGVVDYDQFNTELTINSGMATGGPADCSELDGECDVVSVCYTIPATGLLDFVWENSATDPAADPFGYSINGNNTVGTLAGGIESIALDAGDEFCFLLGSNADGDAFEAVVSNLVYAYDAPNDCENNYELILWTATDNFGNSSSCYQFITKEYVDEIAFPDAFVIQCADAYPTDAAGNPDPSLTGTPEGCNISYTYTDVVIPTLGCAGQPLSGCTKINRTWHAVNNCTNVKETELQQISIVDNEAPIFTNLPATITAGTRGTECTIELNYQLPIPTITDNCSSFSDYTVVTSVGTITNNVLSGVPPGPFTLTYRVEDCCGNSRNQTVEGTVVDNAPPSAVCEQFFTTSLTNDGTSLVFASTFDEGSNDNCNPVWFKAIRMEESACAAENGDDDLGKSGNQVYFDDGVYFCCNDLMAGTHQVIFRVFDVNPGAGPVTPNRMLVGGDLFGHYNDCMVTVTVEDKAPPTISCPTSVTVSCEYWFELDNLSAYFGTVRTASGDVQTTTTMDPGTGNNVVVTDGLAAGNCMLNPQERAVQDLRNDCGLGQIIRTFEVGNGSQQRTCTQIITVEDATPFNLSNISWPAAELNYSDCMQATDPSVTGTPTITGDGVCAQVSVTYDDEEFPVEPNSCFKVKRTWTVKDICQHDADDATAGVWTFIQIISVKNNIDPTFASCDPIEASCGGGEITFTQTVGDDCTPVADLRVDFKIFLDGAANATYIGGNNNPSAGSGMTLVNSTYTDAGLITLDPLTLPDGTHRILWTVEDLCSNLTTCSQTITSGSDNEAPQLDVNSITVSNLSNTVSGFITAFDNCQPNTDLIYNWTVILGTGVSSTSALTGTGNTLTTIDYTGAGIITVQFDVSDGTNSAQLVNQDFNVSAPQSAIISGAISNEAGIMVEDVQVDAATDLMDMTDDNGLFEFDDATTGQNYSVEPTKNTDPRNGISTLDLILISRHMIGLQPLNSPYKMIAADITNDQNIDVFDLIELQQLLIWNISTFTNNQSWRFVDAAYDFPDASNPWTNTIPESYEINGLATDMMDVDFTAIKIGDINGDAVANAVAPAQSRSYVGDYKIEVNNKNVEANEATTIDFVASTEAAVNGMQLTFDLGQFEMTSVEAGMLNVTDAQIANVDGQYVLSVVSTRPVNIEAGEVLFSINVISNVATSVAAELQVNDELINSEVYAGKDQLDIFNADIQMVSDNPITDILYQNRPNPFKETTTVGFYLANDGQANLSIYDVSGKLIHMVEGTYSAGYNQIELNASDIAAQGVVFYQLDTKNFTASQRMIIVK